MWPSLEHIPCATATATQPSHTTITSSDIAPQTPTSGHDNASVAATRAASITSNVTAQRYGSPHHGTFTQSSNTNVEPNVTPQSQVSTHDDITMSYATPPASKTVKSNILVQRRSTKTSERTNVPSHDHIKKSAHDNEHHAQATHMAVQPEIHIHPDGKAFANNTANELHAQSWQSEHYPNTTIFANEGGLFLHKCNTHKDKRVTTVVPRRQNHRQRTLGKYRCKLCDRRYIRLPACQKHALDIHKIESVEETMRVFEHVGEVCAVLYNATFQHTISHKSIKHDILPNALLLV